MYNFLKKQYDKDREDLKSKERSSKEQTQARQSLTAEELHRLEEARRCLGEKYISNGTQRQSVEENEKRTRTNARVPPNVLPKPKKGILKEKSSFGGSTVNHGDVGNVYAAEASAGKTSPSETYLEKKGAEMEEGIIKTPQFTSVKSVILAFEQLPTSGSGKPSVPPKKSPLRSPLTSLSSTESNRSSFIGEDTPTATEDFAQSRQCHFLSSTAKSYENVDLQLPHIATLSDHVKPREVLLRRQLTGDFGFTLRKGTIVDRSSRGKANRRRRSVIFAEPGTRPVDSCGLMPGDQLIEVDGVNVEGFSRDEVIELIKRAASTITLKIEPSSELSELNWMSERSEKAGTTTSSHKSTLQFSSSVDLQHSSSQAKSDDQKRRSTEERRNSENVWLVHKGGFSSAQLLICSGTEQKNIPEEGKCRIKMDHGGEILDVDEEDLEKANSPEFDRVEDLILLRNLNESNVLHTLRQRYASNLIHTNIGPSALIIINPTHPLSTYTERVIQMFKDCKPRDMPPHIYAVARSSLLELISSRWDQSIVFTGRCGSGKTTSSRHSLLYYAITAGSARGIVTADKLNACFTLLDVFANNRNIMNTNSSNFTQVTSANFDSNGHLVSVFVQALTLGRNLLVNRPNGESTFHVFYQMLAGIDSAMRKEFHLDDLNENCLFMIPLQKRDDIETAVKSWSRIEEAMKTLAMKNEERKAIVAILASIYHLGVAGTNGKYSFARPTHAQYTAEILGINIDELSRIIFSSSSQQRTVSIQKSGSGDASSVLRTGSDDLDACLVDLYSEAFQALVRLINRALSSTIHPVASVIVTDLAGFRNPVVYGQSTGATFEDLCHNYVQERLQLLCHQMVLVAEKELYEQENLELDIDIPKTSSMVQLIDGSKQDIHDHSQVKGLLDILDEAAGLGATVESFLHSLLSLSYLYQKEGLLRMGSSPNSLILNHLKGTTPVQYDVTDWLKKCKEHLTTTSKAATSILQKSTKKYIQNISGSASDEVSSLSLRRTGSLRRVLTSAGNRRGLTAVIKTEMDFLVERIRKTHVHFVHCVLPQADAGLCDLKMTSSPSSVPQIGGDVLSEDNILDVPLVRTQLRAAHILPALRMYRQGFPEHLSQLDFLRRYENLIPQNERQTHGNLLNTNENVVHLLQAIDFDKTCFRIGTSQIFLRLGVTSQLNEMRDNSVIDWVIHLQTLCRGHLCQKKINKLKLQNLAAICVQRNVRRLMAIREWPWWRLYTKVRPLLDVHRTENELRDSQLELDQLKNKIEKIENERLNCKQTNDTLERKLSEVMAELEDENAATIETSAMLERERVERNELEKQWKNLQIKFLAMQQNLQQTEMELMNARTMIESSGMMDDVDEDDDVDAAAYREKMDRIRCNADVTRRKMELQHNNDMEQLEISKKQIQRKLAEAVATNEDQNQTIVNMRRKFERLNQETIDIRLHLEQQISRNCELEKKQKKFDSEFSKINENLKIEKAQRERIQQEKDEISGQKYSTEKELKEAKLDLGMQIEKAERLEKAIQDLTSTDKDDHEVLKLKRLKNELDSKIVDLEEELDEQAGNIQQLEQGKLKLEMAQERLRQQHAKELEEKDQDLSELKTAMQKKLKTLDIQFEEEHQEKQKAIHEKRDFERSLQLLSAEKETRNLDVEHNLRAALKRTKALLRDSQMMLEKQAEGYGNRTVIKQLRNQLEDAEYSAAASVKAKKMADMEIEDFKQQSDDMTKAKQELDQKYHQLLENNMKLQTRFEENEEEMAEIVKKYKAYIQQSTVDRTAFQNQLNEMEKLVFDNGKLKEELTSTQNRLEFVQHSTVDKEVSVRLEANISDLETRLDLEQTTRRRAEVQLGRLKEQLEKENEEKQNLNANKSRSDDASRRQQRQMKELEEELTFVQRREVEANERKSEIQTKLEFVQAEFERTQADLHLALKRITDLQAVIENDFENSDPDSFDAENESSADSDNE